MDDESQRDALQDSFAAALSGMPPERECYFLSALSNNVTVAARGVYADELGPEHSLRKLYGLNEVQHAVSNRLVHLSRGDDLWAADSFVKTLAETAGIYDCRDELLVAFKFTLRFA